MIEEIIVGIILFIVTVILTSLGNKYFFKRPKVKLTIQDDYAGSSASEKPEYLKVKWNKLFVIKNTTKHSANDIDFFNLPNDIYFNEKDSVNLSGFAELKIKFSFAEVIEKQKVISLRHNFDELLPTYFREMSIGIKYKNENNKRFYTCYKRINSTETNEYYFRKVC